MQLVTLTILTAISALFLLPAAINQKRLLLMPAGVTMVFIASGLFMSGVQIQDGYNEYHYNDTSGQEFDSLTEHKPVYTELSTDFGSENSSNLLALIYLASGLFLSIRSVIKNRYIGE